MRFIRTALAGLALAGFSAAHAGPPAQPAKHGAIDPEKMTCKRFIRTGSLIDGYRICKKNKEWNADVDTARQVGESIIKNQCGHDGSCGGG